MAIKKDTLDGLLAGRDPQAVFAKDGLFDELKKALAERVLNAEIDDHLDGEARQLLRQLTFRPDRRRYGRRLQNCPCSFERLPRMNFASREH